MMDGGTLLRCVVAGIVVGLSVAAFLLLITISIYTVTFRCG